MDHLEVLFIWDHQFSFFRKKMSSPLYLDYELQPSPFNVTIFAH